jgi:hypothetical protein
VVIVCCLLFVVVVCCLLCCFSLVQLFVCLFVYFVLAGCILAATVARWRCGSCSPNSPDVAPDSEEDSQEGIVLSLVFFLISHFFSLFSRLLGLDARAGLVVASSARGTHHVWRAENTSVEARVRRGDGTQEGLAAAGWGTAQTM